MNAGPETVPAAVPVIETRQLTKTYDGETVINAVTFSAQKGSVHAIAGPNGAGKTTLLKMMASVLKPTHGAVRIFGQEVQDGATIRQRVHYISPEVNLYPFFRVKDILEYASRLYEQWDDERSKLLVDAFSLPLKKPVRSLSLGMKMRLRVVLSLSARAEILLMDEATNGLDPNARDQVLDLILQEVANRDVTVVMATHQLADIERTADTVSLLVGGKLVSTNDLDQLKEEVYEVRVTAPSSSQLLTSITGAVEFVSAGDTLTFVCTGKRADIEAMLLERHSKLIDIRPASLERWFQAMLRKEGVQSEKIVLPESPLV
jgi:ABC-2 type transport system ATP-binding protein